MPYQVLKLRPGVDVEQTPILNESGWSASALARFYENLPQKLGGWAHINPTPLTGSVRALHVWSDLNAIPYIACGSESQLALFTQGATVDITPIQQTDNVTPAFTTHAGNSSVTIQDLGYSPSAGDRVGIPMPVSVGGIVLQGIYPVQTIPSAGNFSITAASAATANVSAAGSVPSFTTLTGSGNVTVALPNHGYSSGQAFAIQVTTAVGNISLTGGQSYLVNGVLNAGNFTIVSGGLATGNATASENGGNVILNYLIPTGEASTINPGYGEGIYGAGLYGEAAAGSQSVTPLRMWSLDNFGQDLVANYNGSPIYIWAPPVAYANVAIPINNINFPGAQSPPVAAGWSFVLNPQQILVAGNVNPIGNLTQDPSLLRWCNTEDLTDWFPSTSNFAGSYRIPSGSKLVGGLHMPLFNLIWTDVDLWAMSFIGGALVFGFNQVSAGCGLLSQKAAGVFKNLVFWASQSNFFAYDGNAVTVIPCTVWDKFWYNLDQGQVEKVFCAVNSVFGEVWWFYPSASGNGEIDSYIKYNVANSVWDYGSLIRLAWFDVNSFGPPIGTDQNGLIQQHEISNDADGAPLVSSIQSGWFAIAEGTLYGFMERVLADLIVTGGDQTIMVTVYTQNYPTGPITTYGPFSWTPAAPPLFIVRARGRFASIAISSTGLGSFWRLGGLHYLISPAGRR